VVRSAHQYPGLAQCGSKLASTPRLGQGQPDQRVFGIGAELQTMQDLQRGL
jgi:hypothetical protein